jgi:hypothetical protein
MRLINNLMILASCMAFGSGDKMTHYSLAMFFKPTPIPPDLNTKFI